MSGGQDLLGGHPPDKDPAGQDLAAQDLVERALCQQVTESGQRLIIVDSRLDPRIGARPPTRSPGAIAWAVLPIHDQSRSVVGVLCVADQVPRRWSISDLAALETLALLASAEVALGAALARGAEHAALAETLQQSLAPQRLQDIPGVQVAVRYSAGTGARVLGDFYDVFPSVRGGWGLVVGDVCGRGVLAAKGTALARFTLRAEARHRSRPSVILASLNQAALDWLTDDPWFLTAIYATIWPVPGGSSVQISSAGHPLALIRRADGRVREFGRPGTLLGLLPMPELSDSRAVLRAGDSLILFTDGITEARDRTSQDFFGEDRLRDLVAGLGDISAEAMAEAIQRARLTFTGDPGGDDAVALVMKVPGPIRFQPVPGGS